MKLAAALLCLSSAWAFAPATRPQMILTAPNMFGGAGEGVPSEDNPEELEAMKQAAASMGMSLEEYKLGISARMRLTKQLDAARVSGGSKDKIAVERDGNNPPKFLEITVSEAGKALGKDGVSKELVTALKTASDESRSVRSGAQKDMMIWIQDEMKKLGKA